MDSPLIHTTLGWHDFSSLLRNRVEEIVTRYEISILLWHKQLDPKFILFSLYIVFLSRDAWRPKKVLSLMFHRKKFIFLNTYSILGCSITRLQWWISPNRPSYLVPTHLVPTNFVSTCFYYYLLTIYHKYEQLFYILSSRKTVISKMTSDFSGSN